MLLYYCFTAATAAALLLQVIAAEGERLEQELISASKEGMEAERLRGFIEVIAAVKQQYRLVNSSKAEAAWLHRGNCFSLLLLYCCFTTALLPRRRRGKLRGCLWRQRGECFGEGVLLCCCFAAASGGDAAWLDSGECFSS